MRSVRAWRPQSAPSAATLFTLASLRLGSSARLTCLSASIRSSSLATRSWRRARRTWTSLRNLGMICALNRVNSYSPFSSCSPNSPSNVRSSNSRICREQPLALGAITRTVVPSPDSTHTDTTVVNDVGSTIISRSSRCRPSLRYPSNRSPKESP